MLRRVLPLVCFTVLVSTTALAQPVPPVLISTPVVSRTVFLSLQEVQTQVDGILRHAAASKGFIAAAHARPAQPLLPPTPAARR